MFLKEHTVITRLRTKKITVIHSFPVWLPQTQTWMYNQVRYLPDDIEAHIVCERTENLDQFRRPHIHSLDRASRWRYHWDMRLRMHGIRRHLGFLVSQARHLNAQIIHSHFGDIGWADMKAAQRAGVRHVVTFYGQDVNFLPTVNPGWKTRYLELFAHVDRVLCEGPHMAKCVAGLGCPGQKIMVQRLGVRVDRIPFKFRQWDPSGPFRVLIASTFREKKGIPYALEALGRFQEEVSLEITIIGDASEAPGSLDEKKKILAVIEKYGLMQKTRMLGYQSHSVFFEEALKHHVFLSPSVTAKDGDTEGGAPVSIIEMAASGMPVISTIHCDIPEVICHGETGLLAPERDVDSLIRHLKWSVEHWDRWSEMVVKGRKHIENAFNAITQGTELAEIYRGVAN
jgi:colanic acid/amylovoran biosynthesis glycosyltransferase